MDDAGGRRFRLLRRLGSGGFGAVYLASVRSASGLEQEVALKLLHGSADANSQAAERLRDEALVLSSLRHPVLLVAHDLVQLGDRIGLITEYVEGEDLGRLIHHRTDPMPIGPLIDVIGQVAGALDTAWRALGTVHRDVKPANIRVGRHGNVKLLDFGIARSEVLTRSAQTSPDAVIGSFSYLAPERFDASQKPHPGSDTFALGCVLYEGATREQLFHGLEPAQLYGLAKSPDFEGFVRERLNAPMPESVRRLLAGLLRQDADARMDAGELASRCDRVLAELAEPTPLRTWCRAHPWPAPDRPERSGQAAPTPVELARRPTPAPLARTTAPTPWDPREESPTELARFEGQPATSETLAGSDAPVRLPAARFAPPVRRRMAIAVASVVLALGLTAAVVGAGRYDPSDLWPPAVEVPAPPAPAPVAPVPAPVPAAVPAPLPPPPLEFAWPPPTPAAVPTPAPPPPAPRARPAPRATSPVPKPTDPAPSAPRPVEPGPPTVVPSSAIVTVVGPPGSFFYYEKMGETNRQYLLPTGKHVCGTGRVGEDRSGACDVRPEKPLVLP